MSGYLWEFHAMNAVKVDEAHRIQLAVLKPGELYEPEVHGPDADEITLRRLKPAQRKMTKAEALKAIDTTPLRFGGTWDELRKETREL
jgi:hypothetical protein